MHSNLILILENKIKKTKINHIKIIMIIIPNSIKSKKNYFNNFYKKYLF